MKAYQYIALAAAALSFAACSQEDDFTPQGNQKDTPITIASAGVAELTTRAAITNGNLEGGSIGVFVTSTSGGRYEGSNIKWTYNDGWGLDDATVVLFENDDEKQQIATYYPYNKNLGTGNVYSITLPEAYDANYEDFDYLYGASAPLASNPATIGLNHLMTKVTVVVQSRGTELGDDEVASIALVGVPRTVAWTVPSATLSGYGDSENITLYRNGASHYGYALPNGANDLTLYITTESGRVFTATTSLDDKMTTDVTEMLTSGMHYTIGVIVGKNKVKINSVSVEPWGDGGALEGGEAEEVTPTIDGTLGGKTTATEDDITALVEKLEEYVDNGITTITVPGSQPAMITVGNVTVTAIGEAIYRLSGNGIYSEDNQYNGKIDLILPDVTEIVDQEFYAAFALNSITLPQVTKIGDMAFQGCYYLKQITFGSVVTSIVQENGLTFDVGDKVDGCDLVLNCGQLQVEDTYKPYLENNVWFKPSWGGNVSWKSITLTHTGECDECKANQ